jgi:ribosomal protein L10
MPLILAFLSVSVLYGLFRLYQLKKLKEQIDVTRIEGVAGNSLNNEMKGIRATARAKGLEGELGIAKILEDLADQYGFAVFHDLSIPGTKANIDHLVVQKKTVLVIDAKNYQGRVIIKKDSKGQWQLYVGKSKQTQLALKLKVYAEKVESHLKSEGVEVRVVPLLAFYNAEFHPDSKYVIQGVQVNVSGIKNELMRFAVRKGPEIDVNLVSDLILKEFKFK